MTLKITIIDDDASVRRAFRILLESAGFDATAFASVRQFIESEHFDNSDCIILDIRMPGASGFDLLEKLRVRGITTPVIVVSAFGEGTDRKRARQLTAKAFVIKPVDDQALVDSINWAVEGGC